MKIGVIGSRGFPEIQGGIETHCQELYTRMAGIEGNRVTVYRRKPYLNKANQNARIHNIRFIDMNVPRNKFLETFLHSFLASFHALFQKYDIIHYHNTGPGFFIPLAKLSGARIVFTYHNVSYTQQKWNKYAKKFLEKSEAISIKRSDYIIFISDYLRLSITGKFNINSRKTSVIYNGIRIPEKAKNDDFLEELGLEKYKFILAVGRFLEEKGFDYLIRAYKRTGLKDIKLVVAGDTDYPTEYSDKLKNLAAENNIILPGFIKGEKLNQLFTFARLYIISSLSEGLPIALLEAMSYDLDVLASDIPANRQIDLEEDDYFKSGDEEDLRKAIIKKLSEENKRSFSDVLSEKYDWDKIVKETLNIYTQLNKNYEN